MWWLAWHSALTVVHMAFQLQDADPQISVLLCYKVREHLAAACVKVVGAQTDSSPTLIGVAKVSERAISKGVESGSYRVSVSFFRCEAQLAFGLIPQAVHTYCWESTGVSSWEEAVVLTVVLVRVAVLFAVCWLARFVAALNSSCPTIT